MTKLVSIRPSPKAEKKLVAVFEENDGRQRVVHFGQAGADDYTITKDKNQRERYRARHLKDLRGDPTRAGYLSYFVLWGDSTSRTKNALAYKRNFGL
jgi:hypothetical protein